MINRAETTMTLSCLLFLVLSGSVVSAGTPWVQYDSAYVGQRPSDRWRSPDSANQLLRRLFAQLPDSEPEAVRVRRVFGTEIHKSWDPWSDAEQDSTERRSWNGHKRGAIDIPDTDYTGSDVNTGDDMVDGNSDNVVHYDFADAGQRPSYGRSAWAMDSQLLRRLFAMLLKKTAQKPGFARARRIFGAELHTSWDHWAGRRRKRTASTNESTGSDVDTYGKEAAGDAIDKHRLLSRAIEGKTVHVHPAALHRYKVAQLGKYVENEVHQRQQDKRHLGSVMRNGGPWRPHDKVKSDEVDRFVGM